MFLYNCYSGQKEFTFHGVLLPGVTLLPLLLLLLQNFLGCGMGGYVEINRGYHSLFLTHRDSSSYSSDKKQKEYPSVLYFHTNVEFGAAFKSRLEILREKNGKSPPVQWYFELFFFSSGKWQAIYFKEYLDKLLVAFSRTGRMKCLLLIKWNRNTFPSFSIFLGNL